MIKIIKGLLLISIVSKISAFFRDFVIVDKLSAGSQTDILLISISIVTVITAIFNTQMRTTFVPIFSSDIKENFSYSKKKFKYIGLFIMALVFSATIFIMIFHNEIIYIMYDKGYENANILLLLSVLITLNGFSLLFNNFLQSALKFGTIEVSSLLNNLCVISFTLFDILSDPINSIVFGYIIGAIIQVIVVILNYLKLLKAKKNSEDIEEKNEKDFILSIKEYIHLSFPITLSSILGQINSLLEKFFAGKLEAGTVTAVYYATTVKNLPVNLFIVTITNVLYSFLGINKKNMEKNFERQNIIIICLSFLSMFGLVLFGPYLVNFLLRNSSTEIKILSNNVLQISNITIFLWAIKDQFFKVMYIKKNTKSPVIINVISICVQSISLWLLYSSLKGLAIPIASVLSNLIGITITIIYCKKINYSLSKYTIKLVVCSLSIFFAMMYITKVIGYLNFKIDNVYMLIISSLVFIIILITYGSILRRIVVNK